MGTSISLNQFSSKPHVRGQKRRNASSQVSTPLSPQRKSFKQRLWPCSIRSLHDPLVFCADRCSLRLVFFCILHVSNYTNHKAARPRLLRSPTCTCACAYLACNNLDKAICRSAEVGFSPGLALDLDSDVFFIGRNPCSTVVFNHHDAPVYRQWVPLRRDC